MTYKKKSEKNKFLPMKVSQDPNESLGQLISAGVYNINILNSITSNVILTDKQFNITYINPAAEKSFDIKAKDVLGKSLFDVNLQGLGVDLKKNLQKVLHKGNTFNVKAVQYLSPAHDVRYLDRSYMPLQDSYKNAIGIISVSNDVTKRIIDEKKQILHQKGFQRHVDEERHEWEVNREVFESQIEELRSQLVESETEINLLRSEIESKYQSLNLVTKNKQMQQILELISKIADSQATVLITGETGTGKELIAKLIHYHSYRRDRRFVGLNCAALTETLLESELFGHVKGSFTGAIRDKIGKFELAHQGTLFLDEVSEMSPSTQSKLLRVLQEREFEKVGGEKNIQVDVRVIAASNKNLEELMSREKFRHDLFYRLKVIPIDLPPLRERMEDIPLLIAFFLKKYCERENKNIQSISQRAMNKVFAYTWPGNIRELENMIEKTVIINEGEKIEDLDIDLPVADQKRISRNLLGYQPLSLKTHLEQCEQEYLKVILSQVKGNIKKASELTGLDRRSIHNKMKKYNLRKENFKLK
jgi:PAS domain S-box-containing protein